jgi:alpha-1,2-mannosyltransferase
METLLFALREAPWLGADRALGWIRVLALLQGLALLVLILMTHGGTTPDPWGRQLATDFASFWTAAKLVLSGVAGAAWDPIAHASAQRSSFGPDSGYKADYYAFFYPPPFLLICLPLALLPYGAAVAAWLAATGAAYFAAIRALLPPSWPAGLVVLAFPAVLLNATHGQNGFLSTALVGTAALQLDRRPWFAGACLGTLCFKPQLALVVVPALVAARRWRSLAWATVTTAALCLGSLLVFGETAWQGFLSNAPLARRVLEMGLVGFPKMVSTFAAARLLGAGLSLAWVAQAVVSLSVFFLVLRVARHRPGAAAEGAIIAVAACLATPFLLDYDLMLLAVPLAWVASMAARSGYMPWEKLVLATAFALPLVARSLATHAGVPVAPLVVTALLAVVVRRARLAPAILMDVASTGSK